MDSVVCSGSFNRSVCFILQDGFVGVSHSFETVIYPLFLQWLDALSGGPKEQISIS